MQDFKKLIVWRKAHRLVLSVYAQTVSFPREEQYGLTSQMRRCSSSIPSNIAEGCGRSSNAQLYHFLEIAMGSACELEYQLILARDLGYLEKEYYHPLQGQVEEVKRMLATLLAKVASRRQPQAPLNTEN